MENKVDGQGDSDVSDDWAIVDFKPEDIRSHLRSSTDSGLCSETLTDSKQASTDNLDECYELTEITDPLGAHTIESSDIDSDGISVIAEDEVTGDWKVIAHENYQDVLNLLETPPRQPEPESQTEEVAPIVPQTEIKLHHYWLNIANKYFIASAVIVVIACIACAQYFKTEPSVDKITDALGSLEKLKMENEKLQFQLQSLTLAYTTLKAKISPEPDIKPKPASPDVSFHQSDDILDLLENFSQNKDPRTRAAIEKLQKTKPTAKILNTLNKLLKRKNMDDILNKLTEFVERFDKKPSKKKRGDGMKIVQWYPEQADDEKPLEYLIPADAAKPGKKKSKLKPGKVLKRPDCDNQNKTGMWYLERGRSRETSRRLEERKEWQFVKGRRDIKWEDEEKGMWYLRRLDLQARSRQ